MKTLKEIAEELGVSVARVVKNFVSGSPPFFQILN
jgi:predicted transcriptional regulator